MPESHTFETDQLLRRAATGDLQARAAILDRYRNRLRRMVAIRIDRRVAARVDPSDVVQDALKTAHERLPEYLADPQLPFYPWLRRIAWDRRVATTMSAAINKRLEAGSGTAAGESMEFRTEPLPAVWPKWARQRLKSSPLTTPSWLPSAGRPAPVWPLRLRHTT
jgi:hypothetical protein